MRKIKARPVKRLHFRPDKANVEFVFCLPIEGALFNQQQCEEHEWQRAKERMWARLRGQPVEHEPNYLETDYKESSTIRKRFTVALKMKNNANKLFGYVGERNKIMFTFVALFLQIGGKSL